MLERINTLLTPLDNLLKKYRNSIWYVFLFLTFCSFGFFFVPNGVKESGEKAIFVLWIILWIPIFARVFGLRIFQSMMPLRKELGILMGTLAFVHAWSFFLQARAYIEPRDFLIQSWLPSYLGFGLLAFLISIPLTLTSSTWMMKKMGKYWKVLHRSVYAIIIFSVVHVVLLKFARHFEVWPVLILVAYFGFKILEWKGITFAKKDTKKSYPKWQKWFCVPCGFIYDPVLGDADSGIQAGTEFTDIPDDWSCPTCGVKKSDFIPYEEWKNTSSGYNAKIIEKTFLNPMTLELVIETLEKLESTPWQFMSFAWRDGEGDFTRSYSIVERKGNRFTFTIKLSENGRGARLLRDIAIGASIRIKWVFGKFLLQDTKNPKVFIATGTGLAPMYNMITHMESAIKKSLYFTVSTKDELFYTEKLRSIPHLDLHIHTTREQVEWYEFGRVDVSMIEALPDTEWYLCGNPRMVSEAREKLNAKWYEKVYSEEF